MVGNDVVDLVDPEVLKGPAHPRFDARVFARSERNVLRESGAPERLRWLLWAAKEAAYKLAKKLDAGVVFSPRRFVVRLDANLTGEVRHEDRSFPVRLAAGADSLHAIATESVGPDRILSGVAATEQPLEASRAVRDLAAHVLATRLRLPEGSVRIGRQGRIPTLELPDHDAPLDLSLSHHGRFVAFACDLGDAA
jgi:hypothetical protein